MGHEELQVKLYVSKDEVEVVLETVHFVEGNYVWVVQLTEERNLPDERGGDPKRLGGRMGKVPQINLLDCNRARWN